MTVEKKYINSISDLNMIKEEWKKLESGKDMTIYQSYDWNELLLQEYFNISFWNVFSRVIIYYIISNENIDMIMPLIVQKVGNRTKWFGRKKGLYLLGSGSYSDYLNLVYKQGNKQAFRKLLETVQKDYPDYDFYFSDIINGTDFDQALCDCGILKEKTTVSVAIRKRESIEEYNKSLSKHVRQNLRTALNRMDRDGMTYDLKVIHGKLSDSNILEKLREVHIERMTFKNTNNTDLKHSLSSAIRITCRRLKERYNNIIYNSMSKMEDSVFVIVYLNDAVAGYLYGLRDKSAIRIMQNCFKNEYKFYSPLFRGAYDFIVDSYCLPEILEIDFTRGNESYKYQLAGEETKLNQYCGKYRI